MTAALCRRYRRNLRVGALLSLYVYSATAIAQTYGWSEINDITKPFLVALRSRFSRWRSPEP